MTDTLSSNSKYAIVRHGLDRSVADQVRAAIDAKQAFLEGYGLSPRQVIAMAPVLRALNVINYAPAVARAAGNREKLEQFRLRLAGALDLYTL